MGVVKVRIWNCTWRGGRPRFTPGPKLRKLIGKGFDLKHDDGRWYTLAEVEAWAAAKKAEVAGRRADKAAGRRVHPARHRGMSVSDLFEEWYKSPKFTGGLKQGKREERGLAPKTIADYKAKARLLCAFDAEFAGSPPAAVSDLVAQGLYETLWEQKGLHMARGLAAVASSCWSWARKRRMAGVTVNPWLSVERQTPKARVVVLEPEEITAWVAACDAPGPEDGVRRPELGDAILLGLFTGQRQGDRLALLDRGRDDAGRRLFQQSKTGAIVAIRETPQLKARLDAAGERRRKAGIVDPHVILDEERRLDFEGPRADRFRKLLAERRAMAIAGIKAQHSAGEGVPSQGGGSAWLVKPCPTLAGKRDQDLRDTSVTWNARAGSTHFEIASVTGHSLQSIHNVLRHYLALHPEMADAAIGKMVKWMDEKGMVV